MRWDNHLVHGFGINDADYKVAWKEDGKQKLCPFYRTWRGMLERCYNPRYIKKFPTYEGCYVYAEWKYFSNFKAWMETQDWEGKQLDKDLLVQGNKLYGPETCVFVDLLTNSFFTNCTEVKGDLPIGVCIHKGTGKFLAQCGALGKRVSLGIFNTVEEAEQVYKDYKKLQAQKLAEMQSDTRVADAILKRFE